MTHYFYSTPERQAALRRYLAAARKSGAVAALQTATGMTLDQFMRELRNYIGRGSIANKADAAHGCRCPTGQHQRIAAVV